MILMTVGKFYDHDIPSDNNKECDNMCSYNKGNDKTWHQNSFIICNSCLWCASCLIGLENINICPLCNKSSISRMRITSNDLPSEEELRMLSPVGDFRQ
jgi:hypothetical protein